MADRDNRLNGASRLSLPINRNDKLGKTDLDDLFRFSLAARSSLTLGVANIKRGANFDVELYSLTPNTPIPGKVGRTEFRKLRASDRNRYLSLVGVSRNGSNRNEAISLGDVAAGDYLIRVLRKQGDSKYRLTTNATLIDGGTGGDGTGTGGDGTGTGGGDGTGGTVTPGNTIQTAIDTTIPNASIVGTVSDADTQDYYKVTTTAASDYLFDLSGTGGDANLEIIGADTSTVLKRGINAGNDKFILPLAGGTYYFRVLQAAPGNTIGYTLNVSQLTDKFSGKYDGGTGLGGATPLSTAPVSNYVVDQGINSPEDLFTFNVTTAQAFATLNLNTMPIGDLDIQLFKEGQTPDQGLTRDFRRNPDGSYPDEVLGGLLELGKYYIRVIPGLTGEGSTYNLSLSLSDKSGNPAISRDIYFGGQSSTPTNITKVDQLVYFSAADELGTALWRSDGTLNGTKKIRAFSTLNKFVAVGTGANSRLYFVANDGSTGEEVWTTDGNTATRVIDLRPGSGGNNSSLPRQLTAVGNNLYFVGDRTSDDTALYRVSGNTITVVARSNATINNPDGTANSAPVINSIANLTGIGNTLYFAGATSVLSDPNNPNSGTATGSELFSISNTDAAPTLTELKPGTLSSSPSNFVQIGNKLFTTAVVAGTTRKQLIRIDSLGANPTYTVIRSSGSDNLSFDPNQKLEYTVTADGSLYFAAKGDLEGAEIFKLDNPATATAVGGFLDTGAPVSDIVAGAVGSNPTNLVSIGNQVFFFANNNFEDSGGTTLGNGRELWSINGATASLVKDVQGGTSSGIGAQAEMVVYQSKVYFTANDGVEGTELWQSDGTNAGTTALVLNTTTGQGADPTGLTPVGNSLFFAATDGLNGQELWSI